MAATPAAPVAPAPQDVDMKADISDLAARLERALRLQTYWLVGTLLAVGGLIFAGLKLL